MTASAARSALRSSSPEPAPSGELGPPFGAQGDEPHRPGRPTRFETRFERLLGGSRYLVMVPVVVLVDFPSGQQVPDLNGEVALMIAALRGFLRFGSQKRGEE